jgi:hypothetical protein
MAKNCEMKRKTSFVGRSVIKVFRTNLEILYRQFAPADNFASKSSNSRVPHDKIIKLKWHSVDVCRAISSISSLFYFVKASKWLIENSCWPLAINKNHVSFNEFLEISDGSWNVLLMTAGLSRDGDEFQLMSCNQTFNELGKIQQSREFSYKKHSKLSIALLRKAFLFGQKSFS